MLGKKVYNLSKEITEKVYIKCKKLRLETNKHFHAELQKSSTPIYQTPFHAF